MLAAFLFSLAFVGLLWVLGFTFFLTRKSITEFLRGIGVGLKKTNRAFLELRRKSFHIMGLTIPIVYYTGLRTGYLTQLSGTVIMSSLTCFIWIVEFGRKYSPALRGNFRSPLTIMLSVYDSQCDTTVFLAQCCGPGR